ncbi:MAG: histidine--tRNA ligase [Acutalibacteraceae bacterium]|jgi:histidyl-tRNA synthetase
MKLLTKAVRGTQDILPSDSYKFRFVQDIMLNEAKLYGFKEIRTPIFEHTELFDRGVGGDTDVVQKEMYTFNDKGGRSLTLKPEGTVSAARAMLEHGIFNDALPLKMTYITPCYRYEKPQSGRYREFYQFGVEMFGAPSPAADAEIICLATTLFERLGISNLSLEINSIGCPTCRKNYQAALKNYFSAYKNELCETCVKRLEKNPMRIVDCKNSDCQKISQNAPNIIDFLCEDCRKHFDDVKKYLDNSNIEYKINPKIVRGLDYYTKTVFEFVAKDDAQRGLVCGGGGRYDGLVEEIGGISMPAVGFGIGVERLLLLMESQEIEIPQPKKCDIFIATADENAYFMALCLAKTLREASFYAEFDVVGRGLKAQLKYAGKINAKFCLVLGESELSLGKAEVKNMSTGEKYSVRLDGNFLHDFVAAEASCELKGLNLLND